MILFHLHFHGFQAMQVVLSPMLHKLAEMLLTWMTKKCWVDTGVSTHGRLNTSSSFADDKELMFIIYILQYVRLLRVCTLWKVWKAYKCKVCAITFARSMAHYSNLKFSLSQINFRMERNLLLYWDFKYFYLPYDTEFWWINPDREPWKASCTVSLYVISKPLFFHISQLCTAQFPRSSSNFFSF